MIALALSLCAVGFLSLESVGQMPVFSFFSSLFAVNPAGMTVDRLFTFDFPVGADIASVPGRPNSFFVQLKCTNGLEIRQIDVPEKKVSPVTAEPIPYDRAIFSGTSMLAFSFAYEKEAGFDYALYEYDTKKNRFEPKKTFKINLLYNDATSGNGWFAVAGSDYGKTHRSVLLVSTEGKRRIVYEEKGMGPIVKVANLGGRLAITHSARQPNEPVSPDFFLSPASEKIPTSVAADKKMSALVNRLIAGKTFFGKWFYEGDSVYIPLLDAESSAWLAVVPFRTLLEEGGSSNCTVVPLSAAPYLFIGMTPAGTTGSGAERLSVWLGYNHFKEPGIFRVVFFDPVAMKEKATVVLKP